VATLQVLQKPRFYGAKTGMAIHIVCSVSGSPGGASVMAEWYKTKKHTDTKNQKFKNPRAKFQNTTLLISKVELEDSGIYFCKIKDTFGYGTELQVLRHINSKAAAQRSNMKDFVIFLQSFLLLLCIVLPLVWHYKLVRTALINTNTPSFSRLWRFGLVRMSAHSSALFQGKKEEAVYEEPEHDHTYEGLEIEHCGDLYEDIRPFCQGTQGPEAAWEVVEPSELESPEVECPEQE
ncbi:hypothetical protein NFI96_020483, partial [Prochilodus magdalenae]